jgi:tetratricopeptide (TPR) repeat protein
MRFTAQPESAEIPYTNAYELAAEEAAMAPNAPDNLYRQAWAAAGIGALDEAEVLIARSLSIAPTNTYGLYYDALIKLELGMESAAIESLQMSAANGYPVAMLATDPLLAVLRDKREFQLLVEADTE